MFAFTPPAREFLQGFFAGSDPDARLRFQVVHQGSDGMAEPHLDRQREWDTLSVIDGIPVVHDAPRGDGVTMVLDYPCSFGPTMLRLLPALEKITLTPAAKAAAIRLLVGSADPEACLRLNVTRGSGRRVSVDGMNVGKEEPCDRAFGCDGLKVVFHQLLVGEFDPHIVDWSPETGRLVSRPA